MRAVRLIYGIFIGVAVLAGCDVLLDERVEGPYRLRAVDVWESMQLIYCLDDGSCVGRIPETVYALGWDNSYVVAATHTPYDRTEFEYYYIIRALDGPYVDPSITVKGPFDWDSFKQEKLRLGLPEFRHDLASLN